MLALSDYASTGRDRAHVIKTKDRRGSPKAEWGGGRRLNTEYSCSEGSSGGGIWFGVGEVGVFGNGLGAGADVELFIHAPDVGIDRGHADIETFGNFFVKVAARQ